ncbi:MAG TPA: DUF4397 domain-containing protein [Bryobacteraceae bacterium]
MAVKILAIAAFGCFVTFPGFSSAGPNEAMVRFVNGMPGETATLSLGGAPVFSNIGYAAVSSYQPVSVKNQNFTLFAPASGNNAPPIASANKGLDTGKYYTVVAALTSNGGRTLQILEDNTDTPTNGKAKVRIINASADEVNVIAPENPSGSGNAARNANKAYKWFSGVSQASATDYKEVYPLNGTLVIERTGSQSGNTTQYSGEQPKTLAPMVQVPVQFQANSKPYTIIVMGGTAKYPLKATIVQD